MKCVYRNPIILSAITVGVVFMIVGKAAEALTADSSLLHSLSYIPFQGGTIMTGLFGLMAVANFVGSRFNAPWESTEWLPQVLIVVAAMIAVLTLVVLVIFNTASLEATANIAVGGAGLILLSLAAAAFIAGLRPRPIRWD